MLERSPYLLSLILLIHFPLCALGEKVPFSLLRKLLPYDPIILEAGAQFGEDTDWMSEMWPSGTIYAFEPSPESYPSLANVASKHNNIVIEQLALSNQIGEFPFYLAGGASSLLRPTDHINNVYFHSDLEHPIMVPVTTLDTWTRNKGITRIDFMWLDMEGNELNALSGGLSILPTVKLVYTEVNLQHFWHGCAMYDDVVRWFASHGFEKIWEDIVPNWHGNVLFMNSNL
jgi:FkbM family methyltransferase